MSAHNSLFLALCDALHVSKTVTTVDISRNNLDTRGIRFILDVIKSQAAARGSAAWHTSLRGRTIDMTVFKGATSSFEKYIIYNN